MARAEALSTDSARASLPTSPPVAAHIGASHHPIVGAAYQRFRQGLDLISRKRRVLQVDHDQVAPVTNVDPTGLAPTCPQSGTVTGTITAANVIAPMTPQGIAAGEFAELVEAMRAGVTYANVHSLPQFPGGEIRGQIRKGKGDKD